MEQKQSEEIKKSKSKTKISKENKHKIKIKGVICQFSANVELHLKDENQCVLKKFQNTIVILLSLYSNRYIAKLSIKKMNELLPDNYTVAKKHFDYLQKQ